MRVTRGILGLAAASLVFALPQAASSQLAAAPSNDLFAGAQAISGSSGSVTGTNTGATKEAGEPAIAGNSGGASVWYTWVAPASGTASISTAGSSFDTLLGVYKGSSVSGLTLVAENDDLSSSAYQSAVRFPATAGETYRIAVDGYRGPSSGQASGSISLAWNQASAPANDLFANAQPLSGATGNVSGSNVGATKETGEPALAGNSGGASVWYRWTAPAAGSAKFTTSGSAFDTLLGVYTGSSVSALTLVGSNDDASSSERTSAVSFTAAAGTTYLIAVDGYNGPNSGQAAGAVALSWTGPGAPAPTPPANDAFANGQVVTGASGSVPGSNVNATKETGEPVVAGDQGGASVWYRWTAPSAGTASLTTAGSGIDTILGVYTGSSVSALTLVASNEDVSSSDTTSAVSFNAVSGTTYMVVVDGAHLPGGTATGALKLNWSLAAAAPPPPAPGAPANDAFANAQSLSGATGTANGSNVGATKETGEPALAGNSGGASVWYTWTAPATGSVGVNTAGSNFDTLLGVYTGSSVSSLTLVAANDDVSSGNHTSALTFAATAGTTYRITVDGYRGSSSGQAAGSITLAWSQSASSTGSGPANDMFANAQTVTGPTGNANGTNVGATKESGEPAIAGNAGGASVWYRWTAPATGAVGFNTSGSGFDTLLAAYTGTTVSGLTLVASNDDASTNDRTSLVSFNAVAGTTYTVSVDGYLGPQSGQAKGTIVLAWTQTTAPTPPPSTGDPLLIAAGDVAYCPSGPAASGAAKTAALIQQYPSATVALLGDGAYDSGSPAEYAGCYNPTWGAFKNRTFPAPGYHDYQTANASGYFGYFGSAAGTPGQGWYSYSLGSWHVVVLNAPLCNSSCGSSTAQMQWLQADLAAHPSTCTVAYWAYPLFTSGTTDGPSPAMKNFWNSLYSAGVDLVLNGHEHSYERFAPQTPSGALDNARGIREFVVGTGGRAEYGFGKTVANSQVRYNATFGVLKLTLHASGYDWQYLPTSGSFTDSGTGACH